MSSTATPEYPIWVLVSELLLARRLKILHPFDCTVKLSERARIAISTASTAPACFAWAVCSKLELIRTRSKLIASSCTCKFSSSPYVWQAGCATNATTASMAPTFPPLVRVCPSSLTRAMKALRSSTIRVSKASRPQFCTCSCSWCSCNTATRSFTASAIICLWCMTIIDAVIFIFCLRLLTRQCSAPHAKHITCGLPACPRSVASTASTSATSVASAMTRRPSSPRAGRAAPDMVQRSWEEERARVI
mmetsp:Transcript_10403/g.25528  ORF Transcript_10403/g.25528 Transcript_10403/m.25528 type:complete len:248 (-) Transcript_10403:200-943(-)